MNRKLLSKAISGIAEKYVIECESYAPEHSGGITRKILALVLAACLILGLSAAAYATGILPSWITGWVQSIFLEAPTDELRQSRPDYAQWLDEQWETRAALEEMGEKAQPANEEKTPEGLDSGSITLLESCYDGVKFSMACRFAPPQRPMTFAISLDDPQFAELKEPQPDCSASGADWKAYVRGQADFGQIQQRLEAEGHVGFTTYDFIVSDHVLVNGEDPGFSHTEPEDNDGIFYVDPYYTSVFGPELPESCRNLDHIEVTFTIRCCETHYWLDGDTLRWMNGARTDYPVSFTLDNVG